MKILLVSSWFPLPADTGGKVRILSLLRHLAARNTVTFLSFARPAPVPEGQVRKLAAICEVLDPVPLPAQLPRPACWFYNPRWHSQAMRQLIRDVLRARRHDLVVATEVLAGFYVAEIHDLPLLLDNCELTVLLERWTKAANASKRWRAGWEWLRKSRFTARLARRFDACTVVSEMERGHLLRLGVPPQNVMVVSNGVDLDTRQPEWGPPEPDTLVYPGALTFHANFDAMMFFISNILPRIRERHPKSLLRITGEFREEHRRQLGLTADSGVELTGLLPDIRSIVGRSAVCVVPLRLGGGTRVKILEAMALGTPVVATRKAAEGLPLQDKRHLLLADRPDEFSTATSRLLEDSVLRNGLIANALDLVRSCFDWKTTLAPIDQFVSALRESGVDEPSGTTLDKNSTRGEGLPSSTDWTG